MRLVPLGATAALACTVLAGCGGSVADADRAEQTRTAPAPPSPFCAAAQANSDAIRPLNALATGRSARPAELSSTVDTVRRTGSDLLLAAPTDIQPDVERTVQAINLQLDALLANGGDAGAVARDPNIVAQLGAPELTAANDRYRQYVARNCGPGGTARVNGALQF